MADQKNQKRAAAEDSGPKKKEGESKAAEAASLPTTGDREVGEEVTLLRWTAPTRPFKKRGRDYFTTIGAIAFLIIIILAFIREFLLIAVVIAFAFVSYIFASVPPQKTEHRLTNRGIRSADKLYRWGYLDRYWFEEKFGQKMVVVQTSVLFPGQLLLMLGNVDEDKLKELLNEQLPHEEPEPTFLDRSAEWLSKKVPLETESGKPSTAAGKTSSKSS